MPIYCTNNVFHWKAVDTKRSWTHEFPLQYIQGEISKGNNFGGKNVQNIMVGGYKTNLKLELKEFDWSSLEFYTWQSLRLEENFIISRARLSTTYQVESPCQIWSHLAPHWVRSWTHNVCAIIINNYFTYKGTTKSHNSGENWRNICFPNWVINYIPRLVYIVIMLNVKWSWTHTILSYYRTHWWTEDYLKPIYPLDFLWGGYN